MPHPRVLLLLLLACSLPAPAAGQRLAVIVHPERAADLGRSELEQIYLKKRRFWKDGTAILPINREAGSAVREAFDRAVFGAERRRLPVYWNREYFRGVLPPATLASEAAVVQFVAGERRAIGYVRSGRVDAGVRTVLLLPADGLGLPEDTGEGARPRRRRLGSEAIRVPLAALPSGPLRLRWTRTALARRVLPTAGIGTLLPEPAVGSSPGAARDG